MGHPNGYQPYGRKVKNNACMNITQDEEVIYLSLEEATKVWLSLQVKEGKISAADADKLWNSAKSGWSGDGKKAARIFVDYASPTQDLGLAAVIAKDLGPYVGKAYLKDYAGKTHIIFKGTPGTRKILTGTRYTLSNSKIVSLGIGKEGIRNLSRKGGILSIVLVTAFNIVDFALNDNVTLSHFIGAMVVDISIVVASAAIGAVVTTALVGAGIITSVVIGPIIAVIAITALAAWGLGKLADKLELKEKIVAALDAAYDLKVAQAKAIKKAAENKAASITRNVVDLLLESAKNELRSRLRKAIPQRFNGLAWLRY